MVIYGLVLLCLIKGTLAGLVPATVYSAIVGKKAVSDKKKLLTTMLSAMLAPIVNTSTFVIGMLCIKYLLKYLHNHNFKIFMIYRILIAVVVLVCVLLGV